MIDIDANDIVATRRTADGRFLIFTSTDVRPAWPTRWWGVVADTRGDGFGFLVRLDEDAAPQGWTARQLLSIARHRMAIEGQRQPSAATATAIANLDLAAAGFRERRGRIARDDPLTFVPGGEPSPCAWTVARCGEFHLPLCPDPQSLSEGVTPEQLLISTSRCTMPPRHYRMSADYGRAAATSRRRWWPRCIAPRTHASARYHQEPLTEKPQQTPLHRAGAIPARRFGLPPSSTGEKRMTPLIGTVIAEAATSAIRGLGTNQPVVVVRPVGRPAPAPWLGNRPPTFDLVVIKIELNLGR
jgi:hypothetical protein